jgi:hypothetical protein
VPTPYSISGHVDRAVTPYGEEVVVRAEKSLFSRKHQEWALNFLIEVRLVVCEVDCRRRAVVFAGAVDGRRRSTRAKKGLSCSAFVEAENKGDAKTAASLFTKDGLQISVNGLKRYH